MTRTISSFVLIAVSCVGVSAVEPQQSDSLSRQLEEIVVTARQPATHLSGTTLVSAIAGSNLQNLGTALDVLAQLPMLSVDDNSVSVAGKGSPEIYIDGRPMRDGDELLRLRSDNIRKVELDLAPGAMYAAETRAVLRITTRRDFLRGLSFTDRAAVEKRRHWSAVNNLGLNYRVGDWDIFADATINRNNNEIKGTTTSSLVYDGRETVVGSSQDNLYHATAGVVKGGFNFADGDRSLGAYYRYNPEKSDFCNSGTEWLDSEPPLPREIKRHISSHSHLVSAYYEDLISGKYLLHFDGDFRDARSNSRVATLYPGGDAKDVCSSDNRSSTLWAARLYLSFPLCGGNFTAGTQDSYTRSRLDFDMLTPSVSQYIPSSLTDARQISAAVFASWKRSFGNLDFSVGARYEYVDYLLRVNGITDDNVSRKDNLLTPDVSLGYSFNEESQIAFSYRMTTVKPPYSQLTGSLNYVGRHEIEGGNPALRDERMHDFQLFGMWKGFMLQADFTRGIDTYGFIKRTYPASSLQLLLQPVNLDVSALDLYLVWSRNVGRWSPDLTLGLYKQWLGFEGTRYDKPIYSYYFNNLFSLPADFQLTINIHGQSSGDMHTNRFGAAWFVTDASVSKSFFDKSLQVKLSATDLFNTSDNDWTMNTCGVFVDKRQSYDHRGISLSVSYRFQPRKSKYKGESASEAELKRL